MSNDSWGWNEFLENDLNTKIRADEFRVGEGHAAARVVAVHRTLVELVVNGVPREGLVLGRVVPLAVGDWVIVETGVSQTSGASTAPRNDSAVVVRDLLPRRGVLSRNAAGRALDSQILAAHVDRIAIAMACGKDFNPSRLERFLVAARQSSNDVVLVLTKADLAPEGPARDELFDALAAVLPADVSCTLVSAVTGEGAAQLHELFPARRTVVLIGASGVGKSTLVNLLRGEEVARTQSVGHVKDRGRHTTTHRELHLCPGGALLLDSPGIRELQLEDASLGLAAVFEDIVALESQCRFPDCRHQGDLGCAVAAAIETGLVSETRYGAYLKMQRESEFHRRRSDALLVRDERRRWKQVGMDARARSIFERKQR